jgi:succinate-semialdehyde dehydrogenase
MTDEAYVGRLMERAREAQRVLESYGQEQVDAIVKVIAKIVFDQAERLARMAVNETRMGVYEDKVKKNQGKARIIWNHLKGKKSVGILRYIEAEGLVEIAKPMGVIGAVTPCTNPIVTPMCNAMFAVKGRNAIIIAPHPRAKKCAKYMEGLYQAAFREMGVPPDIFQVIEEPTIALTNQLMHTTDVVIATGGMGMVKAAYSGGRPSFGVGAGNVQCIVDRDVDLAEAVPKIVYGRTFDNGIICSAEQTVIAHGDDYDSVIAEFIKNGAYYIEKPKEVGALREALFPGGVMNKDAVGQPVETIAAIAGIDIPEGARLIVVKPGRYGKDDLFSKEKMCPVLSAYTYETWEEAVQIAQANLDVEGKGHSASIHSHDTSHVEYAALALPVSRVVVNQICATMNGGSFQNGLNPTTTLGCGSWGNNSISENLTYKHLLNISRIAYVKPGAKQPSDDEIWG